MKLMLLCFGASFSVVIGAAIAGADFHLDRWQIWVFALFMIIGLALSGVAGRIGNDKLKEKKTDE
jgi:hypothetical protein